MRRLREESGVYLLVEDSLEISFSGLDKPIEGLGFISNAKEGLQGFLLHSVLAVRWQGGARNGGEKRPPVEVLGLASQSYRVRDHKPRGRGAESSVARKRRARERARSGSFPGLGWVARLAQKRASCGCGWPTGERTSMSS